MYLSRCRLHARVVLGDLVPNRLSISRFRISSVKLRNHKVGYFYSLLWAVRVMICVETFCIGDKCSVVLCLKNRKYGGVSSLTYRLTVVTWTFSCDAFSRLGYGPVTRSSPVHWYRAVAIPRHRFTSFAACCRTVTKRPTAPSAVH